MKVPELEQVEANRDVGISLMAGEEADAVVEVLREALGDRLRVTDSTSFLKLEATGSLEVRFADVSEVLGRRFTLNDFQMILATYYGRPHMTEDELGVYASMTAGVIDDQLPESEIPLG